uniref:Ribonuclease H protein At1g65750 family n=1 Tax=Cajanus cajan TaxID=3821 RepID=A0A151SZW9_CAJCA|nr:Putative ribonuclease H protein At1g65750 family [Cajanus cajan]
MPKINIRRRGSNLWRGICSTWEMFCQNTMWRIGDGSCVNFWMDNWVPEYGPLVSLAIPVLPISELESMVASYIDHNRRWSSRGRTLWCSVELGMVVFLLILENRGSIILIISPQKQLLKLIHRWVGSKRIKGFLCKMDHGSLLTNTRRARFGLSETDRCVGCQVHFETLLHLFSDCYETCLIWQFFIRKDNGVTFYDSMEWDPWLTWNLSKHHEVHGVQWSSLFGVMLNLIWWRRNRVIFLHETWSVMEVIHKAINQAMAYKSSQNLFQKTQFFPSTVTLYKGYVGSLLIKMLWL